MYLHILHIKKILIFVQLILSTIIIPQGFRLERGEKAGGERQALHGVLRAEPHRAERGLQEEDEADAAQPHPDRRHSLPLKEQHTN